MIASFVNSAKRPSRRAELERLAAKQGWYDGSQGRPEALPEKMVMRPIGGVGYNPVSTGERLAYLRGHAEGQAADPKSKNPYGVRA